MTEEIFSKKMAVNVYVQLVQLILHGGDVEILNKRIAELFASEDVNNPEDFTFHLSQEFDEDLGIEYDSTLFFSLDVNADVADIPWKLEKVLGDNLSHIDLPEKSFFGDNVSVSSDGVMPKYARALRKAGFMLGDVYSGADFGIYYVCKAEDAQKVKELLDSVKAEPYFIE